MADLQKFIDELRAKVSIVDVVGAKVKLVRKGREYTACCPFHNEKTPSFTVNEAKGFYHCFGCGAHGDIVKFEMEANGLPFLEALKKLADKAGLEMPKLSHEEHAKSEERKTLYEIMEMAVQYFERCLRLPEGRHGLEYFYHRGLSDEVISHFRLGYAPANNGLKAWLGSKGISEHEMMELGLAAISSRDNSGRVFDFFRDRVIIPIFDKANRPIAFGGRVMNDGQPKYLNSPETPIFNKRHVLYNLNNAREKGYDAKNIIVCEGYMDVIALSRYGFEYAVAPLGTALTEDQIQEAWRVCNTPTLCFDGDGAGIRAAIRSVDRALPILKPGYSLRYVFLPDGEDPDEFLQDKGHDAFEQYLKNTTPLVDLLWRKNTENVPMSTPEQKALVEQNIMEEVAKITNEQVRNYYRQEMRQRIYYQLGKGSWSQSYAKNAYQKSNSGGYRKGKGNFSAAASQVRVEVARPKTSLDELVAKFIISALIFYPELISEFEEKLSMFALPKAEYQSLLDAMIEIMQEHEGEEVFDSQKMCHILIEKGFKSALGGLWELKMFRIQKPMVANLRADIETKLAEVQIRQLEAEIRDCLTKMENDDSLSEEDYKLYQNLKKERQALIDAKGDVD